MLRKWNGRTLGRWKEAGGAGMTPGFGEHGCPVESGATSQGKKWNRRRRFECKTPNELSFEGVLFEV